MPPAVAVVANRHRPPTITEALGDIPHTVVYTPDEMLPAGFKPDPESRASHIKSQLGAFRCFRGHQLALAQASADHILVLEDDASTNRAAFRSIICSPTASGSP